MRRRSPEREEVVLLCAHRPLPRCSSTLIW
jgi:hypothetical protein